MAPKKQPQRKERLTGQAKGRKRAPNGVTGLSAARSSGVTAETDSAKQQKRATGQSKKGGGAAFARSGHAPVAAAQMK